MTPRPLQNLNTKLTLSYMLGVVGTVPLLLAVSVVIFPFYFYYQMRDPSEAVGVFQQASLQIAPWLRESPPNLSAIEAKIDELRHRDDDTHDAIQVTASGAVTNAAGIVIYSSPPEAFTVGSPLLAQVTPEESRIVQAAQRGETIKKRLGIATNTGDNTVAVPASDTNGAVRGILFARIHERVQMFAMAKYIGEGLIFPIAVLLGASVVVGMIYGSLMARILTRRLQAIESAARDWGRGDFAPTAPETPGDELGVLGARLNSMAREMGELVAVRQQLAATEERTRLARDLHDTVKQHAFAAALQTATALELLPADPESGRAHVERAASLVARMQNELMAILRDLNTDATPDPVAALPAHLQKWSQETGIPVQTAWGASLSVPPASRLALRRIVDEALANIVRHSGATRVCVETATVAGRFRLCISDNGCGFDSANVRPGGMGLGNLRARAQSLPGGGVELETAPGQGTRVCVECDAAPENDT